MSNGLTTKEIEFVRKLIRETEFANAIKEFLKLSSRIELNMYDSVIFTNILQRPYLEEGAESFYIIKSRFNNSCVKLRIDFIDKIFIDPRDERILNIELIDGNSVQIRRSQIR